MSKPALELLVALTIVLSLACGGRVQVRPDESDQVVLDEEQRRLQEERAREVAQVRDELAGAREEVQAAREEQERRAEEFAQNLPSSPVWTFTGTITAASARSLTIEDKKGNRRELAVDAETRIAGAGEARPLSKDDRARKGAEVRATYVLARDGLVARRIEVLRSAGGK